jgi:starch-binding outer membrane protein, SusD/RagB family
MKYVQSTIIVLCIALSSCKKTIDLYPVSNLNTGTYYTNAEEVRTGLNGCYNGLQRPIYREWQLTELRSDNSRMGLPLSTNSFNRDLSDLDIFIPATTHDALYQYWLDSYNNIRNANIVLQRLGVIYDAAGGINNFNSITINVADADRKRLAGEALFIRAYHYFNLVRLYGGVFLVHTPLTAAEAKTINRSSVQDIYKLIEADLTAAAANLSALKFNQIAEANRGRASAWAAKALLGKVYLTLNRKADAITQLQDVIANSGYALQTSYATVFAINNELNSEILFTVRFKAGGFGLGSSFGNDFGPLNSGAAVINGSGLGWNTPTTDIDSSYAATDARKAVSIAKYLPGTASEQIYVKKFLNQVVITGDGEADWPVIRYADVLLMMAEAQGNTATAVGFINQIKTRAGLTALPVAPMATVAAFEKELTAERRKEFAFENQRWFDLLRYGTTLTTINVELVLKAHFAYEYNAHYKLYLPPAPTLDQLQAGITAQRLLLPIPQREIDTNTQLTIAQNPGY